MATSVSINWWNPRKILIGALTASAILYVFCVFSLFLISNQQASSLINYELSLLLKTNGRFLIDEHYREFAESAALAQQPLSVEISGLDKQTNFSFASDNMSSFKVCAQENYFSYGLKFCRPVLVPWKLVSLMSMLYFAVLAIILFAISRSSTRLLMSFREFFIAANISYVEPLDFSKAWAFANSMAQEFRNFQHRAIEFGRVQAREQLAEQLAHDIRSPLSALNFVTDSLTDISSDKKQLLMSISKRINDIANSLLQSKKNDEQLDLARQAGDVSAVSTVIVELNTVISNIIKEKTCGLRVGPKISLVSNLESPRYSLLPESELSRAISNLLNNSLEAIDRASGEISVHVDSEGNIHRILVSDNGKGMSAEALGQFGRCQFSQGKIGTLSGSGLGVLQVVKFIEKVGGTFSVTSEMNKGTNVTLTVPKFD